MCGQGNPGNPARKEKVILAVSLKASPMLVGVALLAAVVLGCYLRAPVA